MIQRAFGSCWMGKRSMIMKGVSVPDHSVIAAGNILTKSINQSHTIIAGTPGKIVKQNIDLDRKFV